MTPASTVTSNQDSHTRSSSQSPTTCASAATSGPRCCAEVKPAPHSLGAIPAAADAMLAQCASVIAAVSDAVYCAPSRVLPGGTLGKHVRHSLDHFRAALGGGIAGTVIDYDHRERDVPAETDRAAALMLIDETRAALGMLHEREVARSVRIRVMLASDGTMAEIPSTLGRELAFATHHAIHHHAMMKAIAAEHGHDLGPDFGKAPSTLNHEATHGACD